MKQFLLIGTFIAGSFGLSVGQENRPVSGPGISADTTVEKSMPVATTPAAADSSVEITTPTVIRDLFEADAAVASSAPRLNPRAVSFVEGYIESHTKSLTAMKGWAMPYFNMMDAIMVQHGLPRELKYLAVIESKLKSNAVSWAGAVGPWQFMRSTAIRHGLKVTKAVDERTNYVKSTHAAARYLKELYRIYGDWLLAIAAYNAGPGNVQKAIARSGSRNFWDLQYFLPTETRNHVKKFIGTHYIFEGQGGLTTLTKAEVKEHYGPSLYAFSRKITQEEQQSAKSQKISGKYQSVVIAKHILMDLSEFNRYNPDFDRVMSTAATGYEMHLPGEKMELFNANKYNILQESVQLLLSSSAALNTIL
ncbi:lytic transglycosylase domain-containing protein [Flavihumibacter stibioxidans]|uniref:lytic transglycosylase domain-containing protein n=1 Tax=Flavihumibacter stibioxidans TaxID=1834163 RepID=UPI0016506337|nr:lytic transglycosylase domain-containing protein [Flavihumibacter stibioxidans]